MVTNIVRCWTWLRMRGPLISFRFSYLFPCYIVHGQVSLHGNGSSSSEDDREDVVSSSKLQTMLFPALFATVMDVIVRVSTMLCNCAHR